MMVTSGVLVILFCGFVAAKPSPQFLPVAVQLGKYSLCQCHVISWLNRPYWLDQPSYQVRHTLKTSVKVTDKDSESLSNRSVPYKLKATVKVRDDKENDIASEGHSDFVVSSNGKVSDVVCRVIGQVMSCFRLADSWHVIYCKIHYRKY